MKIRSYLVLAAGIGASGCAVNPQSGQPEIAPSVKTQFNSAFNSDDPCSNNDRNIGIAVGAVAGGVVGYLTHGTKGAIIGAAAGAGGGFLIGHLMDSRRCSLYKIAQANQLKLASALITAGKLGAQGKDANTAIGLDVQLQNRPDEFEPGSSNLTPAARAYLAQIAQLYAPKQIAASLPANTSPAERAQATQHYVLVVGHTDAQDAVSGADLAALSQARAKAVAEVFAQNGVPTSSIYYQGAGDVLPISSNVTEQGREENNRVQIVDVPTQGELRSYLQQRAANPVNYQTDVPAAANSSRDGVSGTDGTDQQIASAHATTRSGKPPSNSRLPQSTKRAPSVSAAVTVQQAADQPTEKPEAVAAARISSEKQTSLRPDYDFGGSPIALPGESINLGSSVDHSGFGFVPVAHADTPVIVGSCLGDHPHITTPVRNLQTSQELPPRDFVRGFYGTVWGTNANGNLVAITGATIPLDGGAPIPKPAVLIYKNYHNDRHQPPSFRGQADVNVYRGTEKTVYRLFIDGPARCLDLVVAQAQFKGQGNLYYGERGSQYLATPEFAMQN